MLGMLGLTFTVLGSSTLRQLQRTEARVAFEDAAAARVAAMQRAFDQPVEVLHGLAALLAAQPQLDRKGFSRYAGEVLSPGLQVLAWRPRLAPADLAVFEARLRHEYEREIRVRPGTPRVAGGAPLDAYFPILYLEPSASFTTLVGFEGRADSLYRAPMDRARDTGRPAVTPLVRLPGRPETEATATIYLPVFPAGVSPATPAERAAALTGFVSGVVDVRALLDEALRVFTDSAVSVTVYADGPEGAQSLAYATAAGRPTDDASFRKRTRVDLGGRPWTVELVPSESFLARYRDPAPTLALLSGFVITLLASAFLWQLLSRKAQVEAEARARTRALAIEVERRQRAERALENRRSLERLGGLAAGIAHEFNNLIQIIRGFAEVTKGEVPRGSRVDRHMDEVLATTRRASEVVQRILRLSGHSVTVMGHLDLVNVFNAALDRARTRLGDGPVLVAARSIDLARIEGDREQLTGAIADIVVGTARHVPPGRDLQVRLDTADVGPAEAMEWALDRAGTYLRIAVAAGVAGLSVDDVATRPNAAESRDGGADWLAAGVGGVAGVAHRHGGLLRTRETSEGTVVELLLPVPADSPATPPRATRRRRVTDPLRIVEAGPEG